MEDKKIKEISSEILKLDVYDEHNTTITYSTLDMMQPPVSENITFFYKSSQQEEVTVEKLKKSLLATLRHYPDFTGTLQYKKNELLLNYNNKGVQFTTADANFTFKDIEDVQYDLNRLGINLFKGVTFLTERDPLLTVKVITLLDNSLLLLLSIHHAVCDMHGIIWFLNAWASMTKYGNVGHYVNTIDRTIMFGTGEGSRFVHNQVVVDGPPYDYYVAGNLCINDLLVKRSTLENIKADIFEQRTNNDISYITCHDVMSAVFWRAVVKAKGMKLDESARFGYVIDCRKHLPIKNGYFGNCAMLKTLDLKVKDLLSMSVVDVACLIRTMVLSVNHDYLKSLLNFMENAEDRRKTRPNVNCKYNGFLISSWATFDFYSIDFGLGGAKYFSNAGTAYAVMFIYPTECGNKYKVRFQLRDSEMKMFLDNDEVKMLLDE